jgi:nitrite reductase/ring-hydroxylating ferredoxin subunit
MLVNVFNSDGKMKNIVICPFHAAQFDTTNGEKGGNSSQTILRDTCWKFTKSYLVSTNDQEKYDVEIDGNKVKVFCLLVEKRIC